MQNQEPAPESGSGGFGGLEWLFSHVFSKWGILLQILALVHLIRRRGEFYWYWVIFMGGGLGALVYIVVEVVPDLGLIGDVFRRRGRQSRIQRLETDIVDNPSAGNLEELAELHFDQGDFAKARETFNRAIATRADSLHTFYLRALSSIELGEFAAAIPDLEHVVGKDDKFAMYRAEALLAHAYSQAGRKEEAAAWFAHAVQFSVTLETEYNYACFLKSVNRNDEAREWADRILQKKRTMPHYQKRRERPWFRKAQALIKEINKTEKK